MTLSFLFCFKDNLQCMIDNKNYLYISNDYTNWKKINHPTTLYDDQFLNTLQIIGDTIYICCYDYIYSTNYKNIKWEQQIKRYNQPWLGVVQNPNNDNIFIIYTGDNLYLTKDGGKTFDYLLVSGQIAGDKNINLVNQTVCVTSNQIYFQVQNEIYAKTYD
jgi:hypothetical protein